MAIDSDFDESAPLINKNEALQDYYYALESRIGYGIVLGGTRHFGYYEQDTYNPFPIGAALRRMEDRLAKTLNLPAGSQVLDAGCGIGHVALRLAEAHLLQVQGIDVIDHHIVKARRNIQARGMSGKVKVRKMDYHHLDAFSNNSLDGAYTMETLVHSTSPETVASEFYRVLKPGGRVVLFEYEHSDMNVDPKGRATSWSMINKYAAMPAHDRFTYGTIGTILKKAGFTDVKTEDITIHVKPMVLFFFLLAYIPYLFVVALGLQKYFVNTMAGVEGWRARHSLKYVIVSGTKPMKIGDTGDSEGKKVR
jgi:sterol 24-C-methyltransferase